MSSILPKSVRNFKLAVGVELYKIDTDKFDMNELGAFMSQPERKGFSRYHTVIFELDDGRQYRTSKVKIVEAFMELEKVGRLSELLNWFNERQYMRLLKYVGYLERQKSLDEDEHRVAHRRRDDYVAWFIAHGWDVPKFVEIVNDDKEKKQCSF